MSFNSMLTIFIFFLIVILGTLLYYKKLKLKNRVENQGRLLDELEKTYKLLEEIDTLLTQIKDISKKYDSLFKRYYALLKEWQSASQKLENGEGPYSRGKMVRLMYRTFDLKDQIEKEKEEVLNAA